MSNLGRKLPRALDLAHFGKTQQSMVSAAIGTVFVRDSADAARTHWRSVADQLRGRFPRLDMVTHSVETAMQGYPIDITHLGSKAIVGWAVGNWEVQILIKSLGMTQRAAKRRRHPLV